MKNVIGKMIPCQRPRKKPASPWPCAGFGPAAQDERTSTAPIRNAIESARGSRVEPRSVLTSRTSLPSRALWGKSGLAALHLAETPFEEGPVRVVRRELQRPRVRGRRLLVPSGPAEEVRPRGVQQVVLLEGSFFSDLIDQQQSGVGPLRHCDRDG